MSRSYPRRRCERCEYYVSICECGGLCGLIIEYLASVWACEYPDDEPVSWKSPTNSCHQYKKAQQMDLPL